MRGGIWAGCIFMRGSRRCGRHAPRKLPRRPSRKFRSKPSSRRSKAKPEACNWSPSPIPRWSAVKIVRGGSPARDKSGQKPVAEKAETAEIVTFADPRRSPVRVLRGDSERGLAMPDQVGPAAMTMQVVTFANLRDRPVSILRGSGFQPPRRLSCSARLRLPTSIASPSPSTAPNRAMGPICACGARSRAGRRDRCRSLRQRRSMSAAATGSPSRKTVRWAAPISPRCIGVTATGKMRSRPTIGGRATSMPGSAADGPADKLPLAVERYRNRVLREAVLAEPGITTASRWALGATSASGPADRPPVPASVAVAFVADALQRGAAAGNAGLHEFAAALHSRAADWKSAYAGLAGRIVSLARKRSATGARLRVRIRRHVRTSRLTERNERVS